MANIRHHANVAKRKCTVHDLHKVLGHVSQAAVRHAVVKGLVEGITLDMASSDEFCGACVKAKSSHKLFLQEAKRRAKTYGKVVHTDLWGPAQTQSLAGSSYYMSFTDDYSCETSITFLKHKSGC